MTEEVQAEWKPIQEMAIANAVDPCNHSLIGGGCLVPQVLLPCI